MKVLFIRKIPTWYLAFTIGFTALLTFLPNIMELMTVSPEKTEAIYHGKLTEPKVSFACNVFWGEEYLPEMLDTLAANNIKVTFFIGGSWAKRNPEMLKNIAKQGHELGNHTYSHPHPNTLSKEQNKEQIIKAEDLIYELTNQKTKLYAPPYGEFNASVLAAASELNYKTIMWSIDTIDWQRPPKDVIINRVMKKLHNGAIILMHPTEPTAKALPELIKRIKTAGYTIMPVSVIIQ